MEIAGLLQPSSPIIVKLVEPRNPDPTGLAGVLIGALGLTGAILALAVLLGAAAAGALFYIRRRRRLSEDSPDAPPR